jgi:3-methyl-2-oxobutanoate hydroxymethyltransferase
MRRHSITDLLAKKPKGEPIVMVTAYDAAMARLVDEAVDSILVGDSLGMVVQGHDTTLPVTLDEIVYHTRMVMRGSRLAFVVADLPFLSYQASVEDAVRAGGRCLKEGGAQGVKLEGGAAFAPHVRALVTCGIPVVGHLGVTPQSIHALGGFGKQAKSEDGARRLMDDALALQEAGAAMIVLENIPHPLAAEVSARLAVPTIGIGAGGRCDGQVQVFHDLFGLIPEFTPRHAVRYGNCGEAIRAAIAEYAGDVRAKKFVSQ